MSGKLLQKNANEADIDLSETSGPSPTIVDVTRINEKDKPYFKKFLNHNSHKLKKEELIVLNNYFENASSYHPTQAQIAKELGMKKGNVSRAFRGLVEKEILTVSCRIKLCPGRKTPVYTAHFNFINKFYLWKISQQSYQKSDQSYLPTVSEVIYQDNKYYKHKKNNPSNFLSLADQLINSLGEKSSNQGAGNE